MKWILYIMLFVTPAANLTSAEKKDRSVFESHRLWTFQNASTMEFSSFDACYSAQDAIVKSVTDVNVATMTLRTWCFCDAKDALCPDKKTVSDKIKELRSLQLEETKQRLGAAPLAPVKKNYSVERLYPPEK